MFRCCKCQRRDETAENVLHALPDAGTGERVPLQPLFNATPPHRNCAQPLPVGASNQNLVPEPAHEVEEGAQDCHHEHDAAPSDDAPSPSPPAAPSPPDHGRPNRWPQDIASTGRVLSTDRTQRLLPVRPTSIQQLRSHPSLKIKSSAGYSIAIFGFATHFWLGQIQTVKH